MVHLLEDQLKKTNEEVDGEKALQQVMESTLQEKTQDVTQAKKKLAAIERIRDSTDQKVEVLKRKVEESDTKLA